ncbi:MAG: helix-turn-helix transcriptional regulator [Deltaproteobacteria bacterium]|nr:helix-turn-helix transcriptional regulator [Deltaproteobacteria bacterium]
MLKDRISNVLLQLMQVLEENQEGLAKRLNIPNTTLRRYLSGSTLAGVDDLLKIAELAGLKLDELVKSDNPKLHPISHVEIKNSHGVAVAGRDVYMNTVIRRKTEYKPGPDDITGEQSNRLKELVNNVIALEQEVKKKPKTYGAVWNALNRKMWVTYYREIKKWQFEMAELYLMQWIGRIRKGQKRTNEDEWRKKTQSAIFAAARNQLGWTKEALDGYIYERYKKDSIRDLTKKELQQLYNIVFAKKRGA